MARRSARLQKRSPTPTRLSNASWETAHSEVSPHNPQEHLPSVVEGVESASRSAMKRSVAASAVGQESHFPQRASAGTPIKTKTSTELMAEFSSRTPTNRLSIVPAGEEMHPAAHHASTKKVVDAHHTQAATPVKTKSSASLMSAIASRTPTNRTPIKPAGDKMHPALHHASTAKVLDEARWLGFQSMAPQTAPPKANDDPRDIQATPSKTSVFASAHKTSRLLPSPGDFKFRFKSSMSALSPKANRIINDDKGAEASTPARALFKANQFSTPADVPERKMAVPKGKASRFSDVHMAEFKKMDSIANHPSAFRANPDRFKPFDAKLKQVPSKAELNKKEPISVNSHKLKRTQSKMDLAEPKNAVPAPSLKRSPSKMDLPQSSNIPRTTTTVGLLPPSHDRRPQSRDGNLAAKRVKRAETDDAASTRPVSSESIQATISIATPARRLQSKTALPRPMSRLMTPTRSSIARSQSAKTIKTTSTLPSQLKSPSTKNLFSPTNIGETMKEGVREGMRKTSESLQRMRSILRTPNRKFSDDPNKIAAGTHMSPTIGFDIPNTQSGIPATAPVRKHVNFTNSTLARDGEDFLNKSPSPMKLRAGSEVPTGAVIYPKLQSGVQYPSLPEGEEPAVDQSSRRLTFGGATEVSKTPSKFSFASDKPIAFGPATAGTIRMVRKSDASSLMEAKKRKLETLEETSDKENNEPAPEDMRSAKKARTLPEPPKTPNTTSKLPRRTPKHGSGISKSRLAFLATPKRSKA